MQAVIFIGIQASGKSTFYQERFHLSHVRINLDMLKTRHREKRLFETCLEVGQPLVVDNTNPTAEDRQRYLQPAKAHGFRVAGYYFQSKLADAISRNQTRPPEQQIIEKGIRGTWGRLELPRHAEGFDELYYVRMVPGGFAVEEWKSEI